MTNEDDRVNSARGVSLPKIGLGTYRLNGLSGAEAIGAAIDAGYRLIDSAFNYENEGAVGLAVRNSPVDRDELIVTSKLPGRHHSYSRATLAIEESLLRTGLDHLDLYLIHWPLPRVDKYVEAWNALIDAQERGLVRWIGVSNFLPEHLERLERETGVMPSVNQIQLSPYYPDSEMVAFDAEHGIITEAWSPIARGHELLQDPIIVAIAQRHDATPAQIVLAWHMARGVVPIPKSSSFERQVSNLASVQIKLNAEEVLAITALGRPDGKVLDLDPATHEEF